MTRTAMQMTLAIVGTLGIHVGPYAAAPPRETYVQSAAAKPEPQRLADGTLQLKDLPSAVRTTVEAETKNATLKGLSKEKDKGKVVYELESLVNGRTRDLMIDSSGKIYVIEEQLDPKMAPASVRSALEARGTIVVLESVLENGRTTYEGQVKTKTGKRVAIELDADGRPLKK